MTLIRFDCFEVDLNAGQLRREGVRVPLRDQPFQVLASLVEHPGDVVTRDELRRRLWKEGVFVDFENNLNTAVARLREALGDSADHPRFIETLPRRGYRFLASVTATADLPSPTRRPRLIVLPLLNLSGDSTQEYFSDAVTGEVIAALASAAPEEIAVIARTTAMHYKGSLKDVAEIGRELETDYLIEGGVRQDNGQVTVSIQLIDTRNQTHLFADKYSVPVRDLFALQNAIAEAVLAHIPAVADAAGRAERARRKPTEDPVAYNLYLLGRHHLFKGTAADTVQAVRLLEEATVRDPQFALAYDALAEVWWYQGFFGGAPPKEACSTGIYYALRALEIDHTLAETHALLAMYRKLSYDWAEVGREMDLALELNPSSSMVRARNAVHRLGALGRLDEAASELAGVLESDPLSPLIRTWYATTLCLLRDYDGAIEQARFLIELDPGAYVSHCVAGFSYRENCMFDEAIAAHQRAVELSGGSPLMLGWLGLAYAVAGKIPDARAVLEQLHSLATERYVPSTSFAWIHIGLGEFDEAFPWMDRAVEEGDQMMAPIRTYPFFDPMRSDPRFQALLRRMKLEQ